MKASATNQKISWFHREEAAGTLDLSPAFQRRPVWTEEQASYLIDSILNSLPFPEIYIRTISSPSGATNHQVVDGQQRIRAILDFVKNDLELFGDDVSPKYIGKRFEDLTDAEKTGFWGYEVVVRDLSGASDGDIRDLFRRLNIHSVVLNDQELRHAKYKGEFIKTVESLADDEWWIDMRIVNLRQVRRMEDVEFVAELLIGLMAGPQDKKKSLEGYFENYEAEFPEKTKWVAQFRKTIDLIANVLPETEIKAWRGKRDFYTLFLAFGQMLEADHKL